jgi:hypothetical protein
MTFSKALTIRILAIFACIILQNYSFGQNAKVLEYSDLPYIENQPFNKLQTLNLVLPDTNCNSPLLLWIGGGAWSYVNKDIEMKLVKNIAKNGIAVASVGHRLSAAVWKDSTMKTGISHPAHINDVAKAFKWLVGNAEIYGYSKTNIFIGGFSSGAHLAALLGLDSTYLSLEGLSLNNIRGLIPIAGAYDILNYYNGFKNSETNSTMADTHVKAVFGQNETDFINASPTTYLQNLKAPILLISENTTYKYTKIFEEKIRETTFRDFESIHIHKMGHGQLWRHLSNVENSFYLKTITNFIHTNSLKKQ